MTDYGFSWRQKVWNQVHKEVDGYYVFDPNDAKGCLSTNDLRAIADFLDDINSEWANTVSEDETV